MRAKVPAPPLGDVCDDERASIGEEGLDLLRATGQGGDRLNRPPNVAAPGVNRRRRDELAAVVKAAERRSAHGPARPVAHDVHPLRPSPTHGTKEDQAAGPLCLVDQRARQARLCRARQTDDDGEQEGYVESSTHGARIMDQVNVETRPFGRSRRSGAGLRLANRPKLPQPVEP